MKLAIVDDLPADRQTLREHLASEADPSLHFEIEEFTSGEAFLAQFTAGMFDAVFLDIYMEQMTGMDVAKVLFARDPRCKIVFLTTSQDFLLESYSVHATYYLMKPIDSERLRQALSFCFPPRRPSDNLAVRTKGGTVMLARQDILFIESADRHGYVHLANQVIESMDTFTDLTQPLQSDDRFLSCGRGLLIHMAQIAAQEKTDFIMTDGTRLPIPRRSRAAILDCFQDFALRAMEVTS